MKISVKIGLLLVITVFIISIVSMLSHYFSLKKNNTYQVNHLESLLFKERKAQIRDILANAYSLVSNARFYSDAEDALKDMRFGENNKHGFIVFDKDYYCYVYPVRQELENTIVKEIKDADGKLFFQKILKMAQKKGKGYLEIRSRAGKGLPHVRKLLYFQYFKDWQWVICAGVNISDIDQIVAQKKQVMQGELNDQLVYSAGISVIVLVLASITGLLISQKIVAPLKKTSHMFKQIAEGSGDLTTRLNVNGSYETGQLSSNFNLFLEKQQLRIKEILANAETINNSSSHLLKSSARVASETGQTNKKTLDVSKNTEKVKTAIHLTASSMEETVSSIKHIQQVTTEMNGNIARVAREMQNALEITQSAVRDSETISATVTRLESAAGEINNITDLIADISEQTNLLALNATIEAARAGESGKGFAVVANEVKILAGRSNQAAGIITQHVHDIQQISTNTGQRIHQIIQRIESMDPIITEIFRSSEKQAGISSEIATSIGQISNSMEGLNENVSNSSLALEEIDREMEYIASSSGKIDLESRTVEENANELFTLSEKLRSGLTRFKL